jgi:hypothetical protein
MLLGGWFYTNSFTWLLAQLRRWLKSSKFSTSTAQTSGPGFQLEGTFLLSKDETVSLMTDLWTESGMLPVQSACQGLSAGADRNGWRSDF